LGLPHEKHLENSIKKRMNLYKKNSNNNPIKAYINVGGGIASLGNTINGKLISPGLTMFLPMKNFPVSGVIIEMGQQEIPIIHLLNINKLLTQYGLPVSPEPLPEPGIGEIFVQKKYSLIVTSIATLLLVILILVVYFSERKHHKLGADVVYNSQNKENDEETLVL